MIQTQKYWNESANQERMLRKMFIWLKKKYMQLTCNHILTSAEPIMNPETWDMELTCGKCGKVFNCNEDFINGKY